MKEELTKHIKLAISHNQDLVKLFNSLYPDFSLAELRESFLECFEEYSENENLIDILNIIHGYCNPFVKITDTCIEFDVQEMNRVIGENDESAKLL